MRTVACLYIDPRGPYPKMEGVECWDESRDAKLYDGPHPVVAHPPCGPWGRLKGLCTKQDAACGPRAFEQVRAFGGVLEHPEHSSLWDYMGAPKPADATDHHGGRTYLVHQVDWGHRCVKATWLYVVGVDQLRTMAAIRRRRGTGEASRCVSGGPGSPRNHRPRATNTENRRTPPLFADWLVSLARSSRVAASEVA